MQDYEHFKSVRHLSIRTGITENIWRKLERAGYLERKAKPWLSEEQFEGLTENPAEFMRIPKRLQWEFNELAWNRPVVAKEGRYIYFCVGKRDKKGFEKFVDALSNGEFSVAMMRTGNVSDEERLLIDRAAKRNYLVFKNKFVWYFFKPALLASEKAQEAFLNQQTTGGMPSMSRASERLARS